MRRFAIWPLALMFLLAMPVILLAGEPPSPPPIPLPRFYVVSLNPFRVAPVPAPTNPSNANQVLTNVWGTANTAGHANSLAIVVGTGTGSPTNPTNADQVLTNVWNSANSALAVFCVAGCGNGGTLGPGTLNTFAMFTPDTTSVGNTAMTETATSDSSTKLIDSTAGFTFNGTAPATSCLVGDGTEYAPAACQSFQGSGLISGGGVFWTSGLNFTVSAATYAIASTIYTSAQTNLTLAAADVTNPRFDLFVVDNTGTASVITGTPNASPLVPSYDPTTQLPLTSVEILANGTQPPNVTNENIYLENTEYTCTASAHFNCASTNNPFAGTKDIEATTAVAGNNVTLVKPAAGTIQLSSFNVLNFQIRSKAAWANQKSLSLCWYNGTTLIGACVTFKNGAFNFVSSQTASYQQMTISASAWNTSNQAVTTLKISVVGGGGSIGFYLDNIILQGGLSNPPPPPGLQLQVLGVPTANTANLNATIPSVDANALALTPKQSTASGLTSFILELPGTAVTPASYTVSNLTVDQQGRLTAASNGSAHSISTPLACVAASGSGTAYTCTTSPTFVPADGDAILFEADVANTNAATLNVNASSAAPIKKQGGGTALVANDLLAGQDTVLIYDGVNWQMQGQTGNVAGGSVTTTQLFQFDQCTPGETTNPGNTVWNVVGLTAWDAGHWEMALNKAADLFCTVRIPHTVAVTPNANIVLELASSDGTAGHTDALNTADNAEAAGSSLNPVALTAAGSQNYTTTATAYARVTLTFAVQTTVTADELLIVQIHQAASNSVTGNLWIYPYLKIDVTE